MGRRLLRLERLVARIKKIWEEKWNSSGQTYVHHRVAEYRRLWENVALMAGARFHSLGDSVWEIERDGKSTRILNDKLEFDNPVTLEIAGMKPLVYRMFAERGLQVPDYLGFCLEEWDKATEFLARHPKGCVVKPADGTSSGQGVTTHIQTRAELKAACILASLYCPNLLIEPMVPGECYRLLVLDGKTLHAVRRKGPRLVGDGISTVGDVLQKENARRRSRGEHELDVDRDCYFTLGYQGLSLDSVPLPGQTFIAKSVNDPRRKRVEVRTVYNDVVTDLVCDALKRNAETAAAILKSRLVGVDFITVDPTVPLEKSGGVINEVNTTPGLHHHYDASREPFPEPALQILHALLSRR
jgi:cyanophycin synthetase